MHLPGYDRTKGSRASADTERLEQFSSIDRSPIVKPFMPVGYTRHFFFFVYYSFLFAYSSEAGRALYHPSFRFSLSRRSDIIVFGYSSFPLGRPSRFLRRGTFDTSPCFFSSLAGVITM